MANDVPLMTLAAVTLDCADPLSLAAFYAQATGWELVESSGEDFAGLQGSGGFFFGLQRVEDYRPPVWPGQKHPQQAHLDFEVDNLDHAEDLLLQRGAARATQQPDDGRWRVLTDPAGHPFCLTASRTVRQPSASPPTTP